jgi:outer membrane usher protein
VRVACRSQLSVSRVGLFAVVVGLLSGPALAEDGITARTPSTAVSTDGGTTARTPPPTASAKSGTAQKTPAAALAASGAPTQTLPAAAEDGETARTPPVVATSSNINPTGKDITLAVPLRENGPLGQVTVTIRRDGHLLVQANDLANALQRLIKPEVIAKLRGLADASGFIPLEATAANGFVITYDPNAIELAIQIPLRARLAGVIMLGLENDQRVQPDKSAPFAAYLNYRVGETYSFSGAGQGEPGFLSNLEFSGRVFNSIAFENFATLDQFAPNFFSRAGSRLIYDMPDDALRLTAGDLITEGTAFQSSPQIAGFNISHLIDTFYPQSSITSSSSRTLNLTRASDVQLLVNNQPVSVLHLNPGTYDLRNLPVAQGANNIQAVITDGTGQRIVQNFDFFSDINLLDPGLDEYTASFGVLSPLGDSEPDYQFSQPAFSGFYRRGIADQLTGGFNFQATRQNQMGGLDAVLGTNFGLFSLDVSGNRLSTDQIGYAGRLRYRYSDDAQNSFFARTFDLSAEYRSRHFLPVDNGFLTLNGLADNEQELLFSGSLNQPLFRDLTLQFNGDYQISRASHANSGDISAFLTYQAPFDTTVGLGATYQVSSTGAAFITPGSGLNGTGAISTVPSGSGFSLSLTLTHRFGSEDLLTASADRFQQRIDYSRSPTDPVDDYFANADVNRIDSTVTTTAVAGYETNRGNIEATYNNSIDPSGAFTAQQAGVFFDGSIGLAGSSAGVGRHVSDAFAVVSGDPSLEGRTVDVDSRFANQVVAQTGPIGPIVVGTSSYNNQVIPYDVEKLPPGYDLGTGNFEIYPWLHSGFALTVGSPYNVTALGILQDADGNPVSLRTGMATSETDPNAPPVQVITNRIGNFAAPGLTVGRYRLFIPGDKPLDYELTITASPDLLVRLGNVRPANAKKGDTP